ncbi:MAG: hypothetical protein WCF67_24090, partial [Chitinophagaceae bacterium]
KELQKILLQVQDAIRNYIFPKVQPAGYQQLITKEYTTNEIFDGPRLRNGWIETGSLKDKKEVLRNIELASLISALPGISTASISGFDNVLNEVRSNQEQLLAINVMSSFTEGYLEISCKGKKLSPASGLTQSSTRLPENINIVLESGTDQQAGLPKGKYRDINSYYSIQNTFPEIFGVGPDAIIANASDFQIAQSRQLKGYLTLFDQLLANQFSQLANIRQLFSFKNSTSGTPSDELAYYEVQNKVQKEHQQYPVPYRSFSPTYFYQSLYDVPHIRPLLKGHDAFKFSIERETEKELERKSWIAYREDPYNPYIRGLMEFVEDETTALQRRNDMLDHLLARHGELPAVLDAIIEGSKYSGDSAKDRVIFKSLYLQNLSLLSYYRQKAYNYIAARRICDELPLVFKTADQLYPAGNSTDFIINSEKIDGEEKIDETHFVAYSALELKLSLLFGLKTEYRDFIANHYSNPVANEDSQLALWMIQERRGLILIETCLLLQYPAVASALEYLDNTNNNVFDYDVLLIFPAFIPLFSSIEFRDRLELFLKYNLPVHIRCKYFLVDSTTLKNIASSFTAWHNNLIYQTMQQSSGETLNENAAALAGLLTKLKSPAHE